MPNVYIKKDKRNLPAKNGESLMSVLTGGGLPLSTPCGGKGRCKKCLAVILGPDGEKKTVLSCRYPVFEDLTVLDYNEESLPSSPIQSLSLPVRAGVSVDLGTTTIALGLTDLQTGQIVSSVKIKNPLSIYGADVLSRLTYSLEHPLERGMIKKSLNHAIIKGLKDLLAQFHGKLSDIRSLSLAANSAMRALYLGEDPASLVKPPFQPEGKEAIQAPSKKFGLLLPSDPPVHLLPLIESFAGGDSAAAILYARSENLDSYLLVDIGTNTEIVLGDANGLTVCTAPSGPAFEGMDITCGSQAVDGAISGIGEDGSLAVIGGGSSKSICGSGLVSLISFLLKKGALSKDGKIIPSRSPFDVVSREGVRAFQITKEVFLTQKDVRAFQLAKGAIQAGIRRAREDKNPKSLILTGAFGRHLDLDAARAVGLLPDDIPSVLLVENASLEGGARYLSFRDEREALEREIERARWISLSEDATFQEDFIRALSF